MAFTGDSKHAAPVAPATSLCASERSPLTAPSEAVLNSLPPISLGCARRTLDIAFSAVALVALSPLLAVLGIAIRATGLGTAIYRQVRVGEGYVPFTLYKFRSMLSGRSGPEVTAPDDLRITRLGRFLRATSVDELPQLLNVLRGDMTLVGPRPETPALASRYPAECAHIFRYRPGLTGPTQLGFRDSQVIPRGLTDVEEYYLCKLVPAKVAADLDYLARPTLARTLWVLCKTAVYLLGFGRLRSVI